MGKFSKVILVVFFVTLSNIISTYCDSDIKVYEFMFNGNLSYPGKRLVGHVFEEFSTKRQVIQCAYECLKSSRCRSINYEPDGFVCQLNDADHEQSNTSLLDEEPNHSSEYYHRNAFSIDQEALGPCAQDPCQNGARCLDTMTARGKRTYFCFCADGWTGVNCELKMNDLSWGQWEEWSPCSVTCETGFTTRRRNCVDLVTNKAVSSKKCFGRDLEYKTCILQSCPRWEPWQEWGPCSTDNTCGRGMKHRYRTCSNSGIPGIDRFCLGFTNETAPCRGINCDGILLLQDMDRHGEGRVEILDDIMGIRMSICADEHWGVNEIDIACKQIGFEGAYTYSDSENDTNDMDNQEQLVFNISDTENTFHIRSLFCDGSEKTIQACERKEAEDCYSLGGIRCRVRGGWSLWSSWGDCDVTCENGARTRTRECVHPPPNFGGTPCKGDDIQFKHCQLPMCPVDGVWEEWSLWSACDVTCANGTRSRSRGCTGPFYGGAACMGPEEDIEGCFPKMCPVDGVWGDWSSWTDCSHTCGYGNRNRSRVCYGPFYGGADCSGDADDVETCNAFSCPVDGTWNYWIEWGECSVSCGGGLRNRTRECNDPLHGGAACSGPSEEAEKCNEHNCPIDGVFTDWTMWSDCSVTCANGTKYRQRTCFGPYFNGKNCTGSYEEEAICVTEECPVDGVWDSWQSWLSCNVTCGGGTRLRTRQCDGPFFGGSPCDGYAEDRMECNTHPCPVDGVWDDWSSWNTCNVSCGGGYQSRTRTCYGPYFDGKDCGGDGTEWSTCNTIACPVDGEWAPWQAWGACNVSCGGGYTVRSRLCNQPEHGGEMCEGDSEEFKECNEHNCPIDGVWNPWSNWTDCTVTCNTGSQDRYRTCEGPFHDGADCEGDFNETRDCNTDPCPIDGIYSEWSTWSVCSHSCGRGTTYRNRTCFGPYFGGAPCEGPTNQSEMCNPSSCPVHGLWNPWAAWSECSTTCENGTRTRSRTCDGPYNGGEDCNGAWNETEGCFLIMCPVDGVWSPWTEWEECPVTCGGAIQNRTRSCIGPYHNGATCTGQTEESQDCSIFPCPVDGQWSLWTKWSMCNVTCGGGYTMRTRFCSENLHGGSNCTGDDEQYDDCNAHECPVDGVWNPWTNWTECTHTCGTGNKTRFRDCEGPYYDGHDCEGPSNETEQCNTHNCPIDGIWDDWQTWSACNTTCGGGSRWRYRECIGPFYFGAECPDKNISVEDCNTHECPIDGLWYEWSDWEQCSLTCGGGNQSRLRDCEGPYFGGSDCIGPWNETRSCNTHFCPIDGVLSEWSEFYVCDVTCGGGTQWRNRTCIGPFYNGSDCVEPLTDSRDCNTHHCPVDGVWVPWSTWEECDVTCGGGLQWRNRTCEGPFYDGAECEGSHIDNRTCNDFPCPVDGVWMPWSQWEECPVSCGGAIHSRNRTCHGPFHGGAACPDPAVESRDCNTHNCPVDGIFLEWGTWGECDVTCEGGLQWRDRVCEGPFYGGADCEGPRNDSQSCNTQECPVDGMWLEWEPWQDCSTTCGGGTRLRERECEGPFYDGAECVGPYNDTEVCGTDPCPIPGLWYEWSNWTLCSVTCGGGTRYRNRTCDMESFGELTAPCEGEPEEYGECHTFDCLPLAIHCADWASKGLNQSCIADIDPDGEDMLFGPVEVECDFDSEPGKALTVIHHNHENRTRVKGYEGAGEFQIVLDYFVGWAEAIKIIDSSAECKQYMSWECFAAIIHNPFNPDMLTTFWMNRTEQMTNYFGGATPGSGNCRCGETNSCYNNSLPCNCDENDEVWRIDDGFITNKAELPIHSFYAGDTGGTREDGYKYLGPVICSGMQTGTIQRK